MKKKITSTPVNSHRENRKRRDYLGGPQINLATFVPGFANDIFISYSTEDKTFATRLINGLIPQLQQNLSTATDFRVITSNDLSKLESSALALVIASPNYCKQYATDLLNFKNHNDHSNLFVIEVKLCDPRPKELIGQKWYKLWDYDEHQGYISISDDEYVKTINILSSLISSKLISLKENALSQMKFDEERERLRFDSVKKDLVFINCSDEDYELSIKIKEMLRKKGVKCVVTPIKKSDANTARSYDAINKDTEIKIKGCDAILVLYDNASPEYASAEILKCLQSKKDSVKVLALHKSKENPCLGYDDCDIEIYECPPENIETYLPKFVARLQ